VCVTSRPSRRLSSPFPERRRSPRLPRSQWPPGLFRHVKDALFVRTGRSVAERAVTPHQDKPRLPGGACNLFMRVSPFPVHFLIAPVEVASGPLPHEKSDVHRANPAYFVKIALPYVRCVLDFVGEDRLADL